MAKGGIQIRVTGSWNGKAFERATNDLRNLGRSATSTANTFTDRMGRLSGAAMVVGKQLTKKLTLPLAAVGAAAAKASMDFEDNFARIQGLVGVSADETGRMRDAVLSLAGPTANAPRELGDAMFFVASAGLRGQEALDVLEMSAKATAIGLGETRIVADLLTSAINAYGSDSLSAAEATDTLTAAVRLGKLAPEDLAQSIGMVLPLASAMGVRFDEVAASMAAMSRTGTDAATGATQLRQILAQLTKPTAEAQQALASIGFTVADVHKSLRNDGLLATLKTLHERFDGNVTSMSAVFGNVRALSGVLDMLGSNVADTEKIFADLEDTTGELDLAFSIASQTAGFKMRSAFADLQVSLIKVGDVVAPVAAAIAGFVASFVRGFSSLPGPVQTLLVSLGMIVAAVPVLLWAAGAIGKAFVALAVGPIAKLITAFKTMAVAATTNFGAVVAQAKAMSFLTVAKFGAIGLAVAALGAGILYLADRQTKRATERFQTLTGSTEALSRAMLHAAKTGVLTGALNDLSTILKDLNNDAEDNRNLFAKMFTGVATYAGVIPDFLSDVGANSDKARESLALFDVELASLAAVDLSTATDAFETLRARASELGDGYAELTYEDFPQFLSMIQYSADAMGMTVPDYLELAAAGGAIGDEFGEAADQISDARKQLTDWQDQVRASIDPVFALEKASWDHRDAIDAQTAAELEAIVAFSDFGASSPQYVEAARKLEEANRNVESAALDLVSAEDDLNVALQDNPRLIGEITTTYQRLVERGLIPTQQQADVTMGKFKGLADSVTGVPTTHQTIVEHNALQTANDFARLDREINELDRQVTITITAVLDDFAQRVNNFANNPFGRATGGPVRAGTPYMVGERGPELVLPSSDGWVMNHAETRRMLSSTDSPSGDNDTSVQRQAGDINVYVNRSDADAFEIGRELLWRMKVAG